MESVDEVTEAEVLEYLDRDREFLVKLTTDVAAATPGLDRVEMASAFASSVPDELNRAQIAMLLVAAMTLLVEGGAK